jgi:hypothetical protein
MRLIVAGKFAELVVNFEEVGSSDWGIGNPERPLHNRPCHRM